MKAFVDLKYDAETKETRISYQENELNVAALQEIPVSEWGNPFVKSGVRWYGLYEELKNLCAEEKFSIIFHGSEEDMQTIKKILSDKDIEILGEHNKVVLLYHHMDFSTKITVNGKIFDTSSVEGVPLQQLIQPLKNRNWKGLFPELQEYMHYLPFSVAFVGESEDMTCLIPVCPENVDLSYKAAKNPAQSVMKNAASLLNSAMDSIKDTSSDINYEQNEDTGTFQKIVLILDICSIVGFFVLPFIGNRYFSISWLKILTDEEMRGDAGAGYWFGFVMQCLFTAAVIVAYVLAGKEENPAKKKRMLALSQGGCAAGWIFLTIFAFILSLMYATSVTGWMIFSLVISVTIAAYLLMIAFQRLALLKSFAPKAEEIAHKIGLM